MCAARRSVQAVVALLLSVVVSLPAFSQSTRFLGTETRSLHALGLARSAHPCSTDANANGPVASSAGEGSGTDTPLPPCSHSRSTAAGPVAVDEVRGELKTMGKQGQTILRARERVLEILQSENACTAWYRTKDSDPAATFRTITFAIDRKGEAFIRQIPEPGGMSLIRNPYVASVTQDSGPNSAVSINVNGAFFYPAANVVEGHDEGGPVIPYGLRSLQVGPYVGGTLRAQVVVLLHEFGHVIGLLPEDHGDREGKSRQNTLDVVRVCRAEVESKEAPRTFLASR